MNVDNSPASIVAVPPQWSFGAALGSAFPVDHATHREHEECLAKLDGRGEGADELNSTAASRC